MKKMLMLAFVAVSTLVASCGKDKEESVVGTWYFESSVVNGEVSIFDDCKKKSYAIFTDKTFASVVYEKDQQDECVESEKEKGTYTISGNQITIKFEDGDTDTSTFLISGDTLTITSKMTEKGKEYTSVLTLKKR